MIKYLIALVIGFTFIGYSACIDYDYNYYSRNNFPNYDNHVPGNYDPYGRNRYDQFGSMNAHNNPAYNRHQKQMNPFLGNRRCRHHNPVFEICCNGVLHRKRGYLI